MPLTEHSGSVAVRLEHVCDGCLRAVKGSVEDLRAVLDWVLASHERGTRRCADRIGSVAIGELHAGRCDPVDVGGRRY